MWRPICWLILLSILPLTTTAETEKGRAREGSLVNINMSLELDGIERSLDATKQSLDHIASALDRISHSEHLTAEQQQVLNRTLDNLDQLVLLSRDSVAVLPQAFNQTSTKLVTTSQHFLDDIQFKLLIIISAIAALLVVALAAIYWFVLRPLQHTLVTATSNVSSMAKAIQVTAQALESSTQQQQEIMGQLNQKPKS